MTATSIPVRRRKKTRTEMKIMVTDARMDIKCRYNKKSSSGVQLGFSLHLIYT